MINRSLLQRVRVGDEVNMYEVSTGNEYLRAMSHEDEEGVCEK